jgi:hypothetical protein
LRQPLETPPAFQQAGMKKENLTTIGRNGPSAQGYQKPRRFIVREPQPKRVLLIANEVPGAPRL